MKTLLRRARKVKRELNILLALGLVTYLVTEFILRRFPPFLGWPDAHRLADLTSNLCLAYVGSWIFFFVADHFEKVENNEIMSTYLDDHLETVLQAYFSVSFKMRKLPMEGHKEAHVLFRSRDYYRTVFAPLDDPERLTPEMKGLLHEIHEGAERTMDAVEDFIQFKEFIDSRTLMLMLQIRASLRYPKSFIEGIDGSVEILKRGVLGYVSFQHFPITEMFVSNWVRYSQNIEDLAIHTRQQATSVQSGGLRELLKRMASFPDWCQKIDQKPIAGSSNQ